MPKTTVNKPRHFFTLNICNTSTFVHYSLINFKTTAKNMDSKTPPKPEGTVTKKELRNKYKVSTETFRKMLKELNLNTRDKILFPFQLGMIYARYGSP